MGRISKEDLFTIPNILTYFRVLCVPIFAVVYFSGINHAIFVALGIFCLAEFTDIIDGKIARKYNMVSDIGKVIDPLADKLLQITAMVCLTISGNIHWAFVALIGAKELIMILGGIVLISHNVIAAANKWGKRASMFLGYSMILVFFHSEIMNLLKFPLDWVLIGISVVTTYWALFVYAKKAISQLKNKDLTKNENIDIDT